MNAKLLSLPSKPFLLNGSKRTLLSQKKLRDLLAARAILIRAENAVKSELLKGALTEPGPIYAFVDDDGNLQLGEIETG